MPNTKVLPLNSSESEVASLSERGFFFFQSGHLLEAQSIYNEILRLDPKHLDALNLLGIIAVQTQTPSLALELLDRAIKINRNNPATFSNRGVAFLDLELVVEALASFDNAVAINPNYAEAWANRGNALLKLKRFEEALESYDNAISIDPLYAEAFYNRSVALMQIGRVEEALSSCEHAIVVEPNYAEAHSIRAVALLDLRRLDEAVASCERAISLKTDYAEAYYNRGVALKALNRLAEAVISYDIAISIHPNYPEAFLNKSLALLLNGEFEDGWALYEWRWNQVGTGESNRQYAQPVWSGVEEISNKTILLHAEQGLGDTIQFCRYAKLVKNLGARVILEVPASLMILLGELEGVDVLLERGSPLPIFDYHCSLLSLPLAFKTKLETIPNPGPYLAPLPNKCTDWCIKLGEKSRLRIGLVWSGSIRNTNDHNRSIPLNSLIAFLPRNMDYFCLQKEVRLSDATYLESGDIKTYAEQLHDFSDTAALCGLMDVVISVDTSLAHLAGALGKKTFVLLPFAPHWPWLLGQDYSPWYDSMKLIRQGHDGQWDNVLKQLAVELHELM
jgi:tetratricopeptide (TPR) repeat protein